MVKFRYWRKWLYRLVIRLQGSETAIARGVALGIIFGCLMPPGLQLVTGIPISLLLGGNVIAMIAGTFVSNPVTYIPLYASNCKVGAVFMSLFGPEVHIGSELREAVEAARSFNLLNPLVSLGHVLAKLRPVLSCWISGGLIVGLAASVPGYYITHVIVIELRKLREFARARRAERHQTLAARDAAEAPPPNTQPDEEAPDEQPPPPAT